MVNWWAVGLAAALAYIVPKRYILDKVKNYCKYRALNVPPTTVVAILDDIGLNYEKARFYAKKGARMIIGGKDATKIEVARRELIHSTNNKDIVVFVVNRFDKDSLKKFAEDIIAREVSVDTIINNTGRELSNLDIIFTTQELAKERFENHCLNFLYVGLPEDL